MTEPATSAIEIALKHLSPGADSASIEFPELPPRAVSARELQKLLKAFAKLAPTVEYPAEPSIRIESPAGRFVVQAKAGQLNFVSWNSSQVSPAAPSVEDIVRIVAGEIVEGEIEFEEPVAASEPRKVSRMLIIAALVAVVIGLNFFTVATARKPPGNFLPAYRLVASDAASRVLESVVGTYETGGKPGDRCLKISKDGKVQWIKYGPNRSIANQRDMTVQPVEAEGATSLLTSRQALIKIKDPITLTYFGDTYTRAIK